MAITQSDFSREDFFTQTGPAGDFSLVLSGPLYNGNGNKVHIEENTYDNTGWNSDTVLTVGSGIKVAVTGPVDQDNLLPYRNRIPLFIEGYRVSSKSLLPESQNTVDPVKLRNLSICTGFSVNLQVAENVPKKVLTVNLLSESKIKKRFNSHNDMVVSYTEQILTNASEKGSNVSVTPGKIYLVEGKVSSDGTLFKVNGSASEIKVSSNSSNSDKGFGLIVRVPNNYDVFVAGTGNISVRECNITKNTLSRVIDFDQDALSVKVPFELVGNNQYTYSVERPGITAVFVPEYHEVDITPFNPVHNNATNDRTTNYAKPVEQGEVKENLYAPIIRSFFTSKSFQSGRSSGTKTSHILYLNGGNYQRNKRDFTQKNLESVKAAAVPDVQATMFVENRDLDTINSYIDTKSGITFNGTFTTLNPEDPDGTDFQIKQLSRNRAVGYSGEINTNVGIDLNLRNGKIKGHLFGTVTNSFIRGQITVVDESGIESQIEVDNYYGVEGVTYTFAGDCEFEFRQLTVLDLEITGGKLGFEFLPDNPNEGILQMTTEYGQIPELTLNGIFKGVNFKSANSNVGYTGNVSGQRKIVQSGSELPFYNMYSFKGYVLPEGTKNENKDDEATLMSGLVFEDAKELRFSKMFYYEEQKIEDTTVVVVGKVNTDVSDRLPYIGDIIYSSSDEEGGRHKITNSRIQVTGSDYILVTDDFGYVKEMKY